MERRNYIFNFAFILSLIVLVLNDHILKWQFSNWFTGKLSDFTGMVILPLLLAFLFPKLKTKAVWLSMAIFVLWKSPYSQPLLNIYNTIAVIPLTRIIDYTDLLAFAVLPLPYLIIRNNSSIAFLQITRVRISPAFVVVPCMFALMATTPPRSYYYSRSDGDITFYKNSFTIRKPAKQIISEIRAMDIEVEKDTTAIGALHYGYAVNDSIKKIQPYYRIPMLVIDNDTIRELEFAIEENEEGDKSKVYLNGIRLYRDLSDKEVEKELRRYYKKALNRYFKQNFKN
jgi:hypothetical protein